jgi:hypothetical protein
MTGCGHARPGAPAEATEEVDTVVATVPIGVTPVEAASPLQEEATPTPSDAPIAEGYDPFAEVRPISVRGFLMPPTVQHVSETTAQIMFQFEEAQPGILFYRTPGEPPGPVNSVVLDPSYDRHFLTLEDLTPSTKYEFIVRVGEGEPETLQDVPLVGSRWGSVTFRTPPFGPPLRFAVIGDSGFAEPVTFSLAQQMANFDPHFVLHVGDLVYRVYDDPDPYFSYQFKYYGPFYEVLHQGPLYPAVGNHDITDPDIILWDRPVYYWAFPPISDPQFPSSEFEERRKWYAFAANNIQFISLDTQVFFGDTGREEQLVWLEERLADPQFDFSIAFFHVPAYSSSIHRDEVFAVRSMSAMLEGAGVPIAFAGHEHVYERLTVGPTTYLTSGGGSAALYPLEDPDPNSEYFNAVSHFLLVEITSDSIEVQAIAANGAVFDEISLPTPP